MVDPAKARFGPYEILAPLGAGGMGEVYLARDTKLAREVAVKVLPERVAADPEALARFEREARAVAALSHPNILAIHGFGSQDGRVYAVMELLEGVPLRERLRGGALPASKALDYALQIARGLAAAHEKRIVHRDLKPENIFVTKDGQVKILDFGLARHTPHAAGADDTNSPTATLHTEPGTVLGTAAYMSPEQVRGRPLDERSDIFSFGSVLYEMLAGQRAFHRETAAETMSAILKEDPPEPGLAGHAPIGRVLRRCLEKDREHRFHSAHDLAFALEAVGGSTGGEATPPRTAWPPAWRATGALAAALASVAIGIALGRRTRAPASDGALHPTVVRLTNAPGAEDSPSLSPDERRSST